ncbi:MAG: S-layer homology domain-containing protein [Clostridia bacterium]|nr:S-layer homology domain-containing protein [Clostridia bacterium]MBR2847782.1 S-layer homology domain-containing protein [Clostridia bacterium]
MIENAIVRGNGDGTVNPLGNTTRAEAAVIMNRISALRPEYKRLLA